MPLFLVFTIAAALAGVPIVFALAFGPFMDLFITGKHMMIGALIQRVLSGIGKFELLAVPLFILAGEIMNQGGITDRIVKMSQVFVGRLRGGLAHVNILASILFSGLSGSAVADTSALGSILIPAMERDGYTKRFSTAITAASSIIGPIIPPSIIMIVYSYIMEVSVGALFAAGIIPGLLLGGGLMLMTSVMARKYNFPKAEKMTMSDNVRAIRRGVLPMMTPFIILGGILTGIFSPTEAAIVAVVYAILLSVFVFKDVKPKDLWVIFKQSGPQAAVILLVIGSAAMFGWVLTLSRIPQDVAETMIGIAKNKYLFLLIVNIFLLVTGMILDAGPAILILGPIFAPAMAMFGINPVHFAIVMCVNLTVGLATPPFGLVLFAASTISNLPVRKITRDMIPFYVIHFTVIMFITFIPSISLFLPRLLGLSV
jgi:TRAP-type transport system large permease protein